MATCSECTYLDLDKEYEPWDCKYWCSYKGEWIYANCAECYKFCRAYSRSSQVAESFKKRSENSQSSSGCFITTISTEILKNDDKVKELEILRSFRNNVLQKDNQFIDLLIKYDTIGPIIASKLKEDPNKYMIATNLYNLCISKVSEEITSNNYKEAIRLYKVMVELLTQGYNINDSINIKDYQKVNINRLGHGKLERV